MSTPLSTTLLLILLRLLEFLEFLSSPLGWATGIWICCYWLGLAQGESAGLASLIATLVAVYGYCYLERSDP